MYQYNKNCNNQSGVVVDSAVVNQQAILPNITIASNSSTFASTIVANNGIQLPSSSYTISNNMLGYQPSINYTQMYSNPSINANGVTLSVGTVILSPGIYFVKGQIEYFAYLNSTFSTANASISSVATSTNLNLCNSMRNDSNFSINVGNTIIQQVSGVLNLTSSSSYYLVSYINMVSGGGLVIRNNAYSTTATTINSTQMSTTSCALTAANSTICIGCKVTGNGITQPCYVVGSAQFSTITLSTAQSIGASTVLTFSIEQANTNLQATRIA